MHKNSMFSDDIIIISSSELPCSECDPKCTYYHCPYNSHNEESYPKNSTTFVIYTGTYQYKYPDYWDNWGGGESEQTINDRTL